MLTYYYRVNDITVYTTKEIAFLIGASHANVRAALFNAGGKENTKGFTCKKYYIEVITRIHKPLA